MIEIRNLNKVFGETEGSKIYANKNINLDIGDGEFVVILGPSGSGKSTLMNLMSTLESPTSGEIIVDGKDITKLKGRSLTKFRKNNVGFIFQQYYLIPMLTVYENVEVGAHLSHMVRADIEKLLISLGLEEKSNKFPFQLSGGEQQRVAIARALAKRPKILFADEPTGALDENNSKKILKIIDNAKVDYNITIVMVTHNPIIAQISDRVIRMNSGVIVSSEVNESKKNIMELEW